MFISLRFLQTTGQGSWLGVQYLDSLINRSNPLDTAPLCSYSEWTMTLAWTTSESLPGNPKHTNTSPLPNRAFQLTLSLCTTLRETHITYRHTNTHCLCHIPRSTSISTSYSHMKSHTHTTPMLHISTALQLPISLIDTRILQIYLQIHTDIYIYT